MTKEHAVILLTQDNVYLTEQGRQLLESLLLAEESECVIAQP